MPKDPEAQNHGQTSADAVPFPIDWSHSVTCVMIMWSMKIIEDNNWIGNNLISIVIKHIEVI